ncbi:hypothetical protein [Coprococcus comes]|uniref:Preprotein translocase subunit SecB n=1 Tax=Coprococcus comes TaxID=410072 RepID=A0A3R6DXR6_9FIRM|nr:hypothetical protein [Coprococcus comes]RHG57757.1 hypothetical protein DW252_14580 [Coprococcus comes]
MTTLINMDLNSVTTKEAFIINKQELNGNPMKITISRKHEQDPDNDNIYIGTCSAELRLTDELDIDMMDTTFLAKVVISGTFTCNEPVENRTYENIHDTILAQLVPHLRATLAALMTAAGLTPYLIPNSIIFS